VDHFAAKPSLEGRLAGFSSATTEVVKDDFPPLFQGRYLCPEIPDRSNIPVTSWSRSTTAIGYVFNQPNLKESTSGLVITGSRGDSLYGEVVSLLGEAGGVRENRHYENLLFIIGFSG
jgi:hypothetical protein